MYHFANPNPAHNLVGDCVIRAISILTGMSWDETYLELCDCGYHMYDMPSSNSVWDSYLMGLGYKRYIIPNSCPDCYTVREFSNEHPHGRYLLATGSHVVTCIDGDYLDTWDSGKEVPIYYYTKEEN